MPTVDVNVIPVTEVLGTVVVPTQIEINVVHPVSLVPASDQIGDISIDVFGETPMGTINGSNATFTSQYNFIPESLRIMVNGIRLNLLHEYTTSGLSTINLMVSPEVNDIILIDYKKV